MSQGQGQGVQPQAQVPPQGVAQAAPVVPVFTLTRMRHCTFRLQQCISYRDILQGCHPTQT